jgi:ribosomal protein S30
MGMQNFQIFADRDLGSVEFAGHVRDQYPAIVIKGLNNCPPAFFVEHVSSERESGKQKVSSF